MIYQNLKKLREFRNYTQESLAFAMGISQNAYSQIENGHRQIKEQDIIKLAEILGVTIEILMSSEPVALQKSEQKNDNSVFSYTNLTNQINEQKIEIEFLRAQIIKKDEQISRLLNLVNDRVN